MENKQYGIIRMEKYKQGDVSGIQIHTNRQSTKSNTNKDIDYSRTCRNYDLIQCNNYAKAIEERIIEAGVKRKINNTSVVMCQFVCSASPEFFEGKTSAEIRQYFTDCLNFLKLKYGEKNIISATVHLDEKSPHMHVSYVPLTKDNRLCAKEIFTPKKLTELQDQAHNRVFEKYGLARGEKESKTKHISTLNYKIITLQKKEQDLLKEILFLQQQRDSNEIYQMQQQLKSLRNKLSKMFEVLESDADLMAEYKKAIHKLQQTKNKTETEKEEER